MQRYLGVGLYSLHKLHYYALITQHNTLLGYIDWYQNVLRLSNILLLIGTIYSLTKHVVRCSQLFIGICSATRAIADLGADLYVLHTPHGICLSESYGVYVNKTASGDAGWLDHWTEFKVKFQQ